MPQKRAVDNDEPIYMVYANTVLMFIKDCPFRNIVGTSLGSANIPTIEASMASWFSILEALAAYKTRASLSMPVGNTYNHKQP